MMDVNKQIKILSSLINLKQVPETVSSELSRQLSRIVERRKDRNVYIGIIGEFSSGKSTLINSLIDADFFVTNSLQGTTTTPTFIKYGTQINLEIRYKNGRTRKYSSSKSKLIEDFLPSHQSKITVWERFIHLIKGILHLNSYDKTFVELFEEVTTSDEASSIIDSVIVYYPAQILKNGIVIVDTPGTDSLNPQHTAITKNTIANVCDMAIVIIPAEKPASQTLIDFIDDNFSEEIKRRCYYFVTKIELIRRHIERQNHIKGISKRLYAMMDLDYEPKVFMAPTLVSLEYRNIIPASKILSHLDSKDFEMLSNQFQNDICQITKEIESTKEDAINERISYLVGTLSDLFNSSLREAKIAKENDLSTIKKLKTMPLSEFMSGYFLQYDMDQIYNTAEAKISNAITENRNTFKHYIFDKIDNAKTKDETQSVMSQGCVNDCGQSKFDECFRAFTETVEWIKRYYEETFEDFKKSFTETFAISSLDFIFSVRINDSWKKKYHLNFDETNITTTKIFRFFKSLSSVKSQMKEEVERQITKAFEKISKHYIKKIKRINDDLRMQQEKVKKIFVKKYDKIIKDRISEESRKMEILSSQIKELETSLQSLSLLQR